MQLMEVGGMTGPMRMAVPIDTRHRTDLRDYIAAERTPLAWMRIGLISWWYAAQPIFNPESARADA